MSKFIKWFVFTIGFALWPIIIVIIILNMLQGDNATTYNFIPELFFYSLMICSTTLHDLIEIRKICNEDIFFTICICILTLAIISISVFYGCSIVDSYSALSVFNYKKLLVFSLLSSIGSSIMCTVIKIIIIRIEG